MTVTFGFYNSLNGDRTYDAIQLSSIFDGMISDGVFMTVEDAMMVVEGTGMQVIVGAGRAWFNHTWTLNSTPLILGIDTSDLVLNRVDTVVLEVNSSDLSRTNSIKVIKGIPATTPVSPTLTNTDTLHQYPLADIYVGMSVTEITQVNITNRIGTVDCPFITGIIDTIDMESLFLQKEAEFNIWFQAMKDQLTTDAAGNLQNKIDTLNDTISNFSLSGVLETQIFS